MKSNLLKKLIALVFLLGFGASYSQTLPLIGGLYSQNCQSSDSNLVTAYFKSSTADYSSVMFKDKREDFKSNGYAAYNKQSDTWVLVDNRVERGGRVIKRELHFKISSDAQMVLTQKVLFDGKLTIDNGVILANGNNVRPIIKCSENDIGYKANVPDFEQWRSASNNLPLPSPPERNIAVTSNNSSGANASSKYSLLEVTKCWSFGHHLNLSAQIVGSKADEKRGESLYKYFESMAEKEFGGVKALRDFDKSNAEAKDYSAKLTDNFAKRGFMVSEWDKCVAITKR